MSVGQAAKRIRSEVSQYHKMKAIVTSFHAERFDKQRILTHPKDPHVQNYVRARVIVDSYELQLSCLPYAEYEFLKAMLQHGYKSRWWEGLYSTSTYYRMLQRIDAYFTKWFGNPL